VEKLTPFDKILR